MTQIQEVKCFQTSDGVKHDSQLKALMAQQEIDIRGVLQSDARVGRGAGITATQASQAIITNAEEISKIISGYKIKINRLRKRSGVEKN